MKNTMTSSTRTGLVIVTIGILAAGLYPSFGASPASELPLAQYVNPFIGTEPNPHTQFGFAWDTGNVFPGAVWPRGMLAWSPDTTHADNIAGGYWYPDQAIEGFSLTHFSGRGVPCLKDVPFMPTLKPVTGSPGNDWARFAATFSHTNERASAGYYRVRLDDGIETELTATPRTGLARFSFPADSRATLLVRADGAVAISGNEVSGFHSNVISGKKRSFKLYFAAVFDRPFQDISTWQGTTLGSETTASGTSSGAVLRFDASGNPVVLVRVGISYVSVENARANLAAENPTWDFAGVKDRAAAAWNTRLNRVQVEGGTVAAKQVFYTALYHSFIHPNLLDDANGQYPGMDEKIYSVAAGHHQYQNIPAWDQYRSLAPLTAILTPGESSDVMQSLVNYALQDASVRTNGGGLPRWQQVNHNSGGMVGDGDPIIIASSHAFGADQFDTKGALAAMDKGASQPGTTSDGFEVRQGLQEYLTLGYVPNAPSVTLEYANSDFAIAQFALALGDQAKHSLYQNRAQNWKNLYHEGTGLIQPRNVDGSWAHEFQPGSVSDMAQPFVEASAEQTVWMVNFNLAALIEKMGGNDKATARLDRFFSTLNAGMRSEMAYMGNEPSEGIPWAYDFTGAPARTQKVVRRIQDELFTAKPSGLPGNDDAGSLSSWYVFSALGLYPAIPGVAGFAVGSPAFPKATIYLENGKTIQIVGERAAPANCYVQQVTLNGRTWNSPWVTWSALSAGGTINFSLGNTPTSWGQDASQAPPSFDTVKR
ncbi:MAG: GH92 family glycosyl hydrolase [Acidobacteria bacterium]|nr:GH92 family glycosyl hydrolase [Acidobacteriota bacterium]